MKPNPRGGLQDLVPPMESIPKEFRSQTNKWVKFASDWFFGGIQSTETLIPRDGVNKAEALYHLAKIQNSQDLSHGHKEAAVAYLASLWFDPSSTWQTRTV